MGATQKKRAKPYTSPGLLLRDATIILVAFGLPVPVDTRASENTALAPSSANRGNAANMAMSAVANAYALRFFLDKQMDLRI